MPVVNDFPGLYERITQQATDLANRIGIQPEIIIQYFNDTAHFPQTLDELTRWGDTPDPTYGFRRRQPNGVWTPLMQGDTPGTGGANDPGFKHIIANEVGKVQRFQQVDPSGNVFGGSWDPAYNAAHPGGGPGVAAGGTTRSAQGGMMQSQAVDTSSPAYQQANPSGQPYGQATGATPPASGGTGGGGGGGGGATGGNVGYDPAQIAAAVNAANIAQQIEYNRKRLELDRDISLRLDEREKQRIALEAGRDAWKKTYDTAILTGKLPDGTPTIDATKTTADITGYQPNPAAGKGQAVMDAIAALRTNPQYLALDGAGRRQMEAATVSQITGVDTASAAQAIDRLRQLSATTGQMSSAALVEQVIGQTPAGQRPSLDREKEQNSNAIAALTLLSNLQGPENAFTYANTLAGLPESVRANIQAAMQRLPFTAQNPAQRGVLGDVGALGAGATAGGTTTSTGIGPAQPPPGQSSIPPAEGFTPQGALPAAAYRAGGGVVPPGPAVIDAGFGQFGANAALPAGVDPRQGASFWRSPPPAGASDPRSLLQGALPAATGPRTQQQQALQFLPAPEAAPGTPQYAAAQQQIQMGGGVPGGLMDTGQSVQTRVPRATTWNVPGQPGAPDVISGANPDGTYGDPHYAPGYGPYPAPTPGQPGPTPVGQIRPDQPAAGARPWGVSRPGEMYPQVEGPGNPSWEARNPQRNPALGGTPAPGGGFSLPNPKPPGTIDYTQPVSYAPGYGGNPNPAGGNTGPGMAAPLYGPRTQPVRPATAAGMTLPGQLSPTDWNNTSEYMRKILVAGYRNAGEDPNNVMDEFRRSLPRATGPRTGRYRAA